MTCFIDADLCDQAFEEALAPGGSNSPITIKFSLTTQLRDAGDPVEGQVPNAVTQATEALESLNPAPQTVGQISSLLDASTNVLSELQTLKTTWGVLLDRLDRFNTIVADITAVFMSIDLVFHSLNVT